MARLVTFTIFALLFAIVFAQTPSKPTWPRAFSSTVAVRGNYKNKKIFSLFLVFIFN